MFEFAYPLILACLPLPIAVYFLLPRVEVKQSALKVPFYHALAQMAGRGTSPNGSNLTQKIIAISLWVTLVLAGAKPQWIGDPIPLQSEGRDMMLAVDLSGSMKIQDMLYRGQNFRRVDVVKSVVADFVEQRQGDRLGLILFGDNAYLQAPLTFDRNTVKQLLEEAFLGMAGNSTAIGDAIALGIKRLKERPDAARVLILLTDGENTAGETSPIQAAELAAIAGVKIYTIGVASDQLIEDGFGFFSNTKKASADLDENTLQVIADKTGGQYFRAKDTQGLSAIYETLNKIEPVDQDARVYRPVQSLMHWPLALAMLLSLLLALLRCGVINHLPAIKRKGGAA
ncbi:vWA domain-containing protein [Marinagarivorans cellulosilyticus]|uniref:Ca-activated chloride channel homolog n=1 Tax=Marinagarivorans cellulosilyticus TaxID=2721545 RepID=A0AAN1WJ44_9GAMM|nr:VWA domain-containing protein [Marinagarivorans cellulosilyticus]BCD98571.1 Ca-activated chloride channel homolog [Marinagarivorans cellulosilyticus]